MMDESHTAETANAHSDSRTEATAETAAPADALPALEAEVADLKDKLLRTLADMENLRRRTEKEVRDAREYAITGFARDLLSVGDNLSRAVAAVPAEARDVADDSVKAMFEGIDLTGRELAKVMEKHGVKKLDPMGGRFDPNVHQAMFELPNPDVPHGTVVQVLQEGFVIGERVLRPALVGVSKGGPKASATVDKTA